MISEAEIAANPIGTQFVFEDDHVRVWRIVLEPGQEAPFHTHELDYSSIIIEGDVVERPNADGSTDRIEVHPGDVMRWHQGTQRHGLRNVGSKRFSNVIIEIKGLAADFSGRVTPP